MELGLKKQAEGWLWKHRKDHLKELNFNKVGGREY